MISDDGARLVRSSLARLDVGSLLETPWVLTGAGSRLLGFAVTAMLMLGCGSVTSLGGLSKSGDLVTEADIVDLKHLPPLGSSPTPPAAQAMATAIEEWGREHQDAYGGVFLAQGHVYVGFARSAANNLAAVRSRVSRPDLVRAFRADFTYQQLENIDTRMSSEFSWLESQGVRISSVGIDPYHNRIAVVLPKLDTTWVDFLRRRYGEKVLMFSEGLVVPAAGR